MKAWKKAVNGLILLVLAALFLLPVFALYQVSQAEQQQYVAPVVELGRERGYGESCIVSVVDMKETTQISARVVSGGYTYMELSQYKDPYAIRWQVSVGDPVQEGQLIGYYKEEEILAQSAGVIREISMGSSPYLGLEPLDDLVLECNLTPVQVGIMQRSNLNLTDENGVALTVKYISPICSESGTRVLLTYDRENLVYGQQIQDLTLYTGKVFPQTLVVDVSCVYQKPDQEGYFVRVLDEEGYFVREAPVRIGYSNGSQICITGVEEGTCCDTGYKALVEGANHEEG